MTADAIVEYISLDTQVFVATSFGFNGKPFQALSKHLKSGRLKLVMTDITVSEVKARIKKNVETELIAHRTYVDGAAALFNSSLPAVKTGLKKIAIATVISNLSELFDAFIAESKAVVISAGSVTAADVMDKYFKGKPPFGPTENKRFEFPDAFAIQVLAEWAEDQEKEMFVVSGDLLFRDGCEQFDYLIPKASINEVLDHVASDDENLADYIRTETMKHIALIAESAKTEFADRYYWVEDEDGEADVQVTDLIPIGEPEILDLTDDTATLQLSFDGTYKADLSYDDSATASYSEDTLVYVEHREEEVEREAELTVDIEVSFQNAYPKTLKVETVTLTNPSSGFGIETSYNNDWPHK